MALGDHAERHLAPALGVVTKPLSESTLPMEPVFATTRPGRSVNRERSEPVRPDTGIASSTRPPRAEVPRPGQQLREHLRRHQVAGGKPGGVAQPERPGVDPDHLIQELALHRQPAPQLPSPLVSRPSVLTELLRDPVLAGRQDRPDHLRQRQRAVPRQHGRLAARDWAGSTPTFTSARSTRMPRRSSVSRNTVPITRAGSTTAKFSGRGSRRGDLAVDQDAVGPGTRSKSRSWPGPRHCPAAVHQLKKALRGAHVMRAGSPARTGHHAEVDGVVVEPERTDGRRIPPEQAAALPVPAQVLRVEVALVRRDAALHALDPARAAAPPPAVPAPPWPRGSSARRWWGRRGRRAPRRPPPSRPGGGRPGVHRGPVVESRAEQVRRGGRDHQLEVGRGDEVAVRAAPGHGLARGRVPHRDPPVRPVERGPVHHAFDAPRQRRPRPRRPRGWTRRQAQTYLAAHARGARPRRGRAGARRHQPRARDACAGLPPRRGREW